MVHEGAHVLGPAGQVARNLHLNKLGQPGHVLNLLLLELQVSIEASNVERSLKTGRELAARRLKHNLIDGGAGGLSLVALVTVSNTLEHLFVARAIEGEDQGVKVGYTVKAEREIGVKVADSAHVLLALGFATDSIATVGKRVGDDLDSLEVRLKVKEVTHSHLGAVV